MMWYLDFTQLMRDLVRLHCYAVLRQYQEEVYIYIYPPPCPQGTILECLQSYIIPEDVWKVSS